MEPAWWRSGPGANSEYTGHAMDGDLNDPPDVKVRESSWVSLFTKYKSSYFLIHFQAYLGLYR